MERRDDLYRRHQFPSEIIQHAVWLYYCFNPSHRDIENILGWLAVIVTHEAIRPW